MEMKEIYNSNHMWDLFENFLVDISLVSCLNHKVDMLFADFREFVGWMTFKRPSYHFIEIWTAHTQFDQQTLTLHSIWPAHTQTTLNLTSTHSHYTQSHQHTLNQHTLKHNVWLSKPILTNVLKLGYTS